MAPIKAMEESSSRGPYDELYTPKEALEHLMPFLPRKDVVWETAPGELNIVRELRKQGWKVVWKHKDYFGWEPDKWDIQITNPPFSKKAAWLRRANELGKPYAVLLPVTTLGARNCQVQLAESEILFLPKRIDFTGKRAPWFAVAWFTRGLNMPKQLNFVAAADCAGLETVI